MSTADFEELLAILDLNRIDDNTFVGSHPSRNPVRTFGGQMMAQAFVAGSRTVSEKLRPSALSVHFIAGGDPEKDLEFHVVRLRDERRFANRRVDVMQNGELLTTAIISYMNGGSGIEHGIATARSCPTRSRCRPSTICCADSKTSYRISSARCGRSTGATPTTRAG